MSKHEDLSEFNRSQFVMARQVGQSVSKISAVVGFSWICSGQYLRKVVLGRSTLPRTALRK